MKRLSTKLFLSFVILFLFSGISSGQVCDNLCLDFDGADDAVTHTLSTAIGNANFTAEMWFKTPGNLCASGNAHLVQLGDNTTQVQIWECNGNLSLGWEDGTVHGPYPIATAVNDNQWRHLAIVRQGADLLVYLDCIQVFQASGISQTVGTLNITQITLGNNSAVSNANWAGQLDEVRLWTTIRSSTQICDFKDCSLSGTLPPGLTLYWTFDQDGAVPGGDNSPSGTNITVITDQSSGGNNAAPSNFALMGVASNYVCAQLPSAYSLAITDLPTQSIPQASICSGSPVHFCVTQNGMPATAPPGATVSWEYWDGAAWSPVTIPAFTGFCFPVAPGVLTCSGGSLGYDNLTYRAVIKKSTAGQVCTFFSEEKTLQVCCPLSGGTVTINVIPSSALNGTLCEDDIVTLNVSLSGVTGLGSVSTILWSLNGMALPAYDDQTSFSYYLNPVGPNDLCFEAYIENCACAPLRVSACVPVDPMPMVGDITAYPTGTLTLMSIDGSTGHEYYSICPGDDAALQMVVPTDFKNGKAVWQFLLPGMGWKDLGTGNPVQNTNVLPCLKPPGSPYEWPTGAQCIDYRIENRPKSNPSGCDPKYSNLITICLQTPPAPDFIVGDPQICKGDVSVLSVSTPAISLTYTWLHNGEVVGSGPSFSATEAGNYWVEISNGCQTVLTPVFVLEVCEVVAAISCPLAPNQCACAGEPITLEGCVPTYSKDNCSGSYTYTWTFNGNTAVGCSLTDTPNVNGTTYTLTVTNTTTGCSDTTSIFIKPCDSN